MARRTKTGRVKLAKKGAKKAPKARTKKSAKTAKTKATKAKAAETNPRKPPAMGRKAAKATGKKPGKTKRTAKPKRTAGPAGTPKQAKPPKARKAVSPTIATTPTPMVAMAAATAGPDAAVLPRALIDMHCHVFNGTDLPSLTFIEIVLRERDTLGADPITVLIALLRDIVFRKAPRAADELADLRGEPRPPPDDFGPGGGPAIPTATAAAGIADGGGLFGWIRLFGLSRGELIDRLAGMYTATGHHCVLMTPALVDYDAWLTNPDDREHRRLTDQVRVMGALARRRGKPRVHGFLGFDPVRALLAREGKHISPVGTPIDPHALLDEAIHRHGFLGVKLYPPMGFRAWRNDAADMTFPQRMKDLSITPVFGEITDRQLGRLIDRELEKLYRYCAEHGVPILAHAYNSNQAGACYGWRASPQYWGEVIEKFSTPQKPLHIALAHFGRFDAHTRNPGCVPPSMAANVWETVFGSVLHKPGAAQLYADMSYFSEVLDRTPAGIQLRRQLAQKLKRFFADHDPDVRHVCYGSDWIMLGREGGHARYHKMIGAFLRDEVGLTGPQLANFFFGNAVNFLGLQPGGQSRQRLEKFYRDNGIEDQFPVVDAQI